jgi:GTPase SAR1 family protein
MIHQLYIGVVGGTQVGKKSLVENHICKYFNGRKITSDHLASEYIATIVTNIGPVKVNISIINDVKSVSTDSLKDIDCFIIVSDVSDSNMHKLFKTMCTELIHHLGNNISIINCFNKTDITCVDTYIFDSSAPTFDISVKTTSGINDMLAYILRSVLKKERLLICM